MNSTAASNLTLVIGGTGKTGRRIVERLQQRNVPVRVGSRSNAIPFDWDDQSTWLGALEGVTAVYIAYAPDLAIPAAPPAINALVDLCKRMGVQRAVLLSGRGEEEAQRCEAIVRGSGIPMTTIVRASWFAQNFNESFFCDALRSGELALPVAAIGEPFVDLDDVADVAVAALTEAGHGGEIYEVTGPRLLTFTDAVREIAAAAQRPFQFRAVGTAEFEAALREQQTPQEVIELLNYLFTTVLDGRNAHVTDGVQRALGRPPRDFSEYARAAAATGVWR